MKATFKILRIIFFFNFPFSFIIIQQHFVSHFQQSLREPIDLASHHRYVISQSGIPVTYLPRGAQRVTK